MLLMCFQSKVTPPYTSCDAHRPRLSHLRGMPPNGGYRVDGEGDLTEWCTHPDHKILYALVEHKICQKSISINSFIMPGQFTGQREIGGRSAQKAFCTEWQIVID